MEQRKNELEGRIVNLELEKDQLKAELSSVQAEGPSLNKHGSLDVGYQLRLPQKPSRNSNAGM